MTERLFLFGVFTGACYAEFGVRVPHTTGSAYMYSYVTVGELIAFIIGWNMVLEYLIGTSACACALSACLDALANGAISEAIANSVGTILGEYIHFEYCPRMQTINYCKTNRFNWQILPKSGKNMKKIRSLFLRMQYTRGQKCLVI